MCGCEFEDRVAALEEKMELLTGARAAKRISDLETALSLMVKPRPGATARGYAERLLETGDNR